MPEQASLNLLMYISLYKDSEASELSRAVLTLSWSSLQTISPYLVVSRMASISSPKWTKSKDPSLNLKEMFFWLINDFVHYSLGSFAYYKIVLSDIRLLDVALTLLLFVR